MFIYSITNTTNNYKYIGVSIIPLDARQWHHANEIEHIISILKSQTLSKLHTLESFSKLAQAFIQYGEDSFKWEVLESHTKAETLYKRQKYFITLNNSFHNGYNNYEGLKDISIFQNAEKELNLDGYFSSEKVSGVNNVNSKLSYDDIQEIKNLISYSNLSQPKIAKQFKVSLSTIKRIAKSMKLVDDEYSQSPINPPTIKPVTGVKGFTPEQIENINQHILSGQYTKKELQETLNLTEHKLKVFTKQLRDTGHTVNFKSANTALTDEQAREIKLIIRAGSMSQNGLAKQYGVSKIVIQSIRKGETYTHVVI